MAFAPSKRKRLQTREPVAVSLTSMMDMMVIILLFLLKTYAVTGALLRPAIDNLPLSTSDTTPRKTLSLVLTKDGLFEDADDFASMSEAQREARRIAAPAELEGTKEVRLPSLESFLKQRRELEASLGKRLRSRELTIQASKEIPYAWVLKLINTASLMDYDVYEFVVERDTGGGP